MTDSVSGIATGESFVLGLEANAIDSLVHAVEHFLADERPTDLKYTVLHIFHAVELFLKARLATFCSELIYEKPRKDGKRHTVKFRQLKKRLSEQGVVLSEQDRKNLDYLQEIRNSIEHHRIDCSRNDIEEYVGCAIYFLETFLLNELEISLKDALDEVNETAYYDLSQAYKVLSKAKGFYLRRMQDSDLSLRPKERCFDFFCLECGEQAIVQYDPRSVDRSTYCFCCHTEYSIDSCSRCEQLYLSEPNCPTKRNFDDEYVWFCDLCRDYINAS
jgi:hypothetical protein